MAAPNPTPTQRLESLLRKNEKYAETYKPPNKLIDGIEKNKKLGRKGMAVISCSDPRIHPVQYLGLDFGEAAIIRNAGGRTSDVMRTLLDLDAIGSVGTVVVIHHTDCGMTQTNEEGFQGRIEKKHPALAHSHSAWGAINDPYQTIVEDVEYLKSFQTIFENMEIFGLVLDIFTGQLKRVV